MASTEATGEGADLIVVFAPGLWPMRSTLDGLSWLIGERIARTMSAVEGLVGYVSPRGRVESAGAEAFRVYRSLPPNEVIRAECDTLGARWAVTGRILDDRRQMEAWLNLLDGRTLDLLWTDRVYAPRSWFLWRLVPLLRKIFRQIEKAPPSNFGVHCVAPSGSFEATAAYARAVMLRRGWRGDVATGTAIVAAASRAFALDYALDEAAALMLEVGQSVCRDVASVGDAEAFRDAIVGSTEVEPARVLRRAIHERLLALAKGADQT